MIKNLQLWISVDGVGKVGEYVRHGFNDANFENQIKTFAESGIKPPDTGYMITYGVMNFLHLFDMVLSFIERDFTPAREEQAESRLHRNGQKNAVTAWYIVAKGTVDEKMDKLVRTKRKMIGQVITQDEILECVLEGMD